MVDQWSQLDEQKVLPEGVEAPKENPEQGAPVKETPLANPVPSEGNGNEEQQGQV